MPSGFEGSPIRDLTLRIECGQLKQSGTLHKGVDLPFEVTGTLSATDDGQIRMHTEKVKSAHVPVKGLLHLFGEHLDALVKTSESRGVKIEGDDFILVPERLIPPPRIEGKVVKVRTENTQVVMELGGGRDVKPLAPTHRTPNYIYHQGGILRFGKLTMQDADLEIVDDHPRDAFEFSLKQYNHAARQTVTLWGSLSRLRSRLASC